MDFPPDWTPDRGSGVSGCCCPMDTGLGGLFGPRPRPLTMRVRERGRGPNRKEGWVVNKSWIRKVGWGSRKSGVREGTTEQRRRRARRWQRCDAVAVRGVGGADGSAASTAGRSWRHQRSLARRRARRSRSSWRWAAGAVLGGCGARRRGPARPGRPSARRRGCSSDAEPWHRQDVPTVAARPPITTHARRPRLVPPRVEAVP
jgi:hypothetical protein